VGYYISRIDNMNNYFIAVWTRQWFDFRCYK